MSQDKFTVGFFIVWAVSALLSIGITVGLYYAIFHFIRKFW